MTMLQITVCVGSSCYLKGSWQVVQALQDAIAEYHLESMVELKAGFCLGHCRQGVAVQVGQQTMLAVQPDEALSKVFFTHILPEVKTSERTPH